MIPFHASIRKAVAVGLKKGFAASDNLDPRRKLCPRAARWKYIQGKAHMPLKDQIKNYAKKLVENRPASSALSNMVRVRKPLSLTLRDDGIVPNKPRFPLLCLSRCGSAQHEVIRSSHCYRHCAAFCSMASSSFGRAQLAMVE
jgi:hypothetical protein